MIHPVIENILSRTNQEAPATDGRKIALVLYGGIMVGVRGAGALIILEQSGLTKAFDEIYTMSSGFLNASYFLAGQMKTGAAAYYKDLSGSKFLSLLRFWKIANVDYLMEVITKLRPINTKAALANRTRLYDMLINAKTNQAEYLEIHEYASDYINIIRASTLLPFVAHGSVKIGQNYYRDILQDHNLADLLTKALDSRATDILVIYNYPWQKDFVNSQIKNIDPVRVYQFCPLKAEGKSELRQKLKRFDTNPQRLKKDCLFWAESLNQIFENQIGLVLE